jgi:hypothetical protein
LSFEGREVTLGVLCGASAGGVTAAPLSGAGGAGGCASEGLASAGAAGAVQQPPASQEDAAQQLPQRARRPWRANAWLSLATKAAAANNTTASPIFPFITMLLRKETGTTND